jgi:hypothetical protein
MSQPITVWDRVNLARVDAEKFDTYDPNDPNYHSYDIKTRLCWFTDEGCQKERAPQFFEDALRFQFPFQDPYHPVVNMQNYTIDMGKISQDPIMVKIDRTALTASNITRPGHRFYPGIVDRQIVIRDDGIWIVTRGRDVGGQKYLNYLTGEAGFRRLDMNLHAYINNKRKLKKYK